jgi:hypothetical protein
MRTQAIAQITWNKYSRMMIGMGIPSSQSRSPRMWTPPGDELIAKRRHTALVAVASLPTAPGIARRKGTGSDLGGILLVSELTLLGLRAAVVPPVRKVPGSVFSRRSL